jgi:ABC-2 type transport system ATP-binding protein
VLQSSTPEADLSVCETIELYAGYYRHPRPTTEILALTGLEDQAATRNRRLSGGQQRRLDVALALVGDPAILFLDEPTTGFDPAARRQAWSTIRSLCELGKTIFLTTHFMDEAQHLADRVAVMREGEIIAAGRPDEIGGRDLRPAEIRFTLPARWSLGDLPQVASLERSAEGDRVLILTRDPVRAAHELTGWALEHGVDLGHFSVAQPTLEDIYLELTGGSQHNSSAEEAAV